MTAVSPVGGRRVLQFGTGRFLRGFVDAFLDEENEADAGAGSARTMERDRRRVVRLRRRPPPAGARLPLSTAGARSGWRDDGSRWTATSTSSTVRSTPRARRRPSSRPPSIPRSPWWSPTRPRRATAPEAFRHGCRRCLRHALWSGCPGSPSCPVSSSRTTAGSCASSCWLKPAGGTWRPRSSSTWTARTSGR